jgi:hypothetical protein
MPMGEWGTAVAAGSREKPSSVSVPMLLKRHISSVRVGMGNAANFS